MVGKNNRPIEDGTFVLGKKSQRFEDTFEALIGLACQVERPCQARMQPGGKRILAQSGAEQIDGLVKSMAAERKHRAHASNPWIVGQMRREGKSPEGRVQIPVYMEVDPAERGQNGFRTRG